MIEFRSGERFGQYLIEDLIARGGMGVLYKARQAGLERVVALKLIAPELLDDEAFTARFLREARLAASIDHPNVVPIFEVGEADERLFISMRYVPGTDLRRVLAEEGALPPQRAARVVAGIAAALDAAHELGLVHRDVKPANVLLASPDEHVYLTDFGLAKPALSESIRTQTGQLMGTVDYVAPEQIESGEIDGRADVYSLGCVLFHALAGRVPYEGSEVQTLWQHAHAEPPRPGESNPDLAPFDPVVERAMAKVPANRFSSAGELARALEAALRGEQITTAGAAAGRASLGRSARSWRDRVKPRTWLATALATVAIALAVLAATGTFSDDASSPTGPDAGARVVHQHQGFATRWPADWRRLSVGRDVFGVTVRYASDDDAVIAVRRGVAGFVGRPVGEERAAPDVNPAALASTASEVEFEGGECLADRCVVLGFTVLDGDEYQVWGPLSEVEHVRLVAREIVDVPDYGAQPITRCRVPQGPRDLVPKRFRDVVRITCAAPESPGRPAERADG